MTDHESLVGLYVELTLTDDSVVGGTVFTYVEDKKMLVLMMSKKDGNPFAFKMYRTPFIRQINKVEKERAKIPADLQLPTSFQSCDALPPVNQTIENSTKAIKYLNNDVIPSRKKRLNAIHQQDSATNPPLAAVDIFMELQRVFNDQAVWNAEEQVIQYSDLVISGKPDWAHPAITVVNGSTGAEDLKKRISTLVDATVAKWSQAKA